MNLDFTNPTDVKKGQVYLDKLILDQSKAEIVKISPKRTNSQNRYVHALFQLWSSYHGYTLEEGKTVVKIELGYTYEKDASAGFDPDSYVFLKQTSKMNTKELTVFIDKFRNKSAANGFYLPSADEFRENFTEIMNEVERAEIMEKRYGY